MHYAKGHKNALNEDHDVNLSPVTDPRYYHVCPIALLLIHAMRHSLVRGKTINEVLEHTASSRLRQIEWLYPHRPVLGVIRLIPVYHVDLDSPSSTWVVNNWVKKMGLVSNILSRVHIHAARLGTAQDVSHLDIKPGSGFASDNVRQVLHHTHRTSTLGVTDNYVGPPDFEIYNERVKRQYEAPTGPGFAKESALEFINAPINKMQIKEWQEKNKDVKTKRGSKPGDKLIRLRIRRERAKLFMSTATRRTREPLSEWTSDNINSVKESLPAFQPHVPQEDAKGDGIPEAIMVDPLLSQEDGKGDGIPEAIMVDPLLSRVDSQANHTGIGVGRPLGMERCRV